MPAICHQPAPAPPLPQLAVKLVNFSPVPQRTSLRFQGLAGGSLGEAAELLVLGSCQPLDENSFDTPTKARPCLMLRPWPLPVPPCCWHVLGTCADAYLKPDAASASPNIHQACGCGKMHSWNPPNWLCC